MHITSVVIVVYFFVQKDCKGTPYSIIGATNPNCKYHALNLGGWEDISPFPPLDISLYVIVIVL